MKKKIISLALTLMLLIGVLSILPAYAAEGDGTGAVTILAQNVVYGETVQLAYALDVSLEEAENVTLEYYLESDPTKVYKAKLLNPENPNNVYKETHPVFATYGFYAKDFTDVVCATAYVGDSAPADAEYSKYSVAEYLYARLYKDGFIHKELDETSEETVTATKPDSDRKNLYLALMNYGRYAQEVLVNNEGGNEALITDYCYLYTEKDSDVKINGMSSALFAPGAAVTLTGASGYMFTTGDGEITEKEAEYTAEAGKIAKVTAAALTDTYTVTDYQGGYPYSDFVKSYDADGNLITGNLPASANTLTMGLASSGENSFLQVRNYANSGKVGTTKVELSNTIQEGNCYTFQTKIQISGGTGGYNFANVKFVNNNGGEALNLYLKLTANASGATNKPNLAIATTGTNSSIAAGTTLFDLNKKAIGTGVWFTLRIEFYFEGANVANTENTYMKLYVDDILAYDGLASWAIGANINRAEISHVSAGKTHNICYDDIFFTRTDKAYTKD